MASLNEQRYTRQTHAEIRTLMFNAYHKHAAKKKKQPEIMPEVDLVHRILEQDAQRQRYRAK